MAARHVLYGNWLALIVACLAAVRRRSPLSVVALLAAIMALRIRRRVESGAQTLCRQWRICRAWQPSLLWLSEPHVS
jgi:hypothetical protein